MQNINKAYKSKKKTYDLRTRYVTYEIREQAYRRNFVLSNKLNKFNAKLTPKFLKEKIKHGNHCYELEVNCKVIGKFHTKDLEKCMA